MAYLISLLFQPPPIPDIQLPFPARMSPGIKLAIGKVYEMVYYRGLYDGFIAGALLTLLLVPSIRNRVAKGAYHVAEAI